MTRHALRLLALTMSLVCVASPLAAQTPITAVGLGSPVDPIDGRAAALGGTGIGLLGGSFSIRSPADLLLHGEPAFGLSFSGESVSIQGANQAVDSGRERFTVISAIVPFGDWAASLSFGSEFDQDWSARFQDTLAISDGNVPFNETREHDGGVSSINLTMARTLGPVGLGVSVQRLTGSLRQSFFRIFDLPLDGAPQLGSAGGSQELSYSALRFRFGGLVNVSDRIVLSGAFGLGSSLEATIQDSLEAAADFDLPGSVEVGGSIRLTDQLLVTAAGGWEGWDTFEPPPSVAVPFTSHDVTWYGGGLEYGALSLLGGRLPVRVGLRRTGLPFSPSDESLTENAITGGFGWEFQQGLAVADLSFETGTRGDFAVAGLEESFTRFTLSFTLRQRGR